MSVWDEARTFLIGERTVRAVRGHAITIAACEAEPSEVAPDRLVAAFPSYVAPPPDDATLFDGPSILATASVCAPVAGDPMRSDGIAERVAVVLGAYLDARYLEPLAGMKPSLRVWRLAALETENHRPLAFDDGERRLVVMPRLDAYGALRVVTVNP